MKTYRMKLDSFAITQNIGFLYEKLGIYGIISIQQIEMAHRSLVSSILGNKTFFHSFKLIINNFSAFLQSVKENGYTIFVVRGEYPTTRKEEWPNLRANQHFIDAEAIESS